MTKKANENVNVDNDNDDSDDVETTPAKGTGKKRLRKIYFTCAAIKRMPKRDPEGNIVKEDGKQVIEPTLLMEEIEVPSIQHREQALDTFKKAHGVAATNVIGPNYRVRGTASAEKRVAVTLPANAMRMSGKTWEGVFQGWKVLAQGIKGFSDEKNGKTITYADDEVVYLFFNGPVNEKENLPKPRFGGSHPVVVRSSLESAKAQA